MPEAGIVVVTHESESEIGACLDAALLTGADIVVVDNASSDGTCAEVTKRGVRLIANPDNRGFAAAVNQGIRALDAPLVLLLNPDAHLETGIEALYAACREPGVAAACGKLVDATGLPQRGFAIRNFPSPAALIFEVLGINRLWRRNPINWHYRCMDFDFAIAADVEQPAGAFLMIRRDVWEELGGFDERFHPLWFEDVDYCLRARQQGYRTRYTPASVAKHTGGHSAAKISLENRPLYWYRGLLRYAAKHYSSATVRIIASAVLLGSIPRSLWGMAASRSRAPIRVYGKVMALASGKLVKPAD